MEHWEKILSLNTTPIFSSGCLLTVQVVTAILGSPTIALAESGSTKTTAFIQSNHVKNSLFLPTKSFLLAQATATTLYVNPSEGNDAEDGSDRAPFKTIAHALKVAQSGTTILLAPGVYSRETGEIFPLVLPNGVTIQGDPATRGAEILIRGGGVSTREAGAQHSITIEISSEATLKGVTVTNPNSQGYGVAIDSSNGVISNSTLTGNGYGLVIRGNSTAQVENNYFYQNQTAGIEIVAAARPTIQDNIFEQTGSAVVVGDRAAPLIAGNRITQNQNGMVFQGSAQPIVRKNSVEGNRQYGLLAKDSSRPDLGTAASPGDNFFRNNGLADVHVKATNQTISAVGNEWLTTMGTLNTAIADRPSPMPIADSSSNSAAAFPIPASLSGKSAPSEAPRPIHIVKLATAPTQSKQTTSLKSINSAQSIPTSQPFPKPSSVQPAIAPPRAVPIPPRNSIKATTETFPLPPSVSPQPVRAAKPLAPEPIQRKQLALSSAIAPRPIAIPVPPPETITPELQPVQRKQLALSPAIAPRPIAIPVPPPEIITPSRGLETQSTRPIRAAIQTPIITKNSSTNLLPVPSPNIPLGKIGSMPSVYSLRGGFQPNPTQNTLPFPTHSTSNTIRFRVVVPAEQPSDQAQVLALVPDAFLTTSKNKIAMQVGAFSDRVKAEQLIQTLANQGISSNLEPINQ
jgi:parallel beta-helix repeat protein